MNIIYPIRKTLPSKKTLRWWLQSFGYWRMASFRQTDADRFTAWFRRFAIIRRISSGRFHLTSFVYMSIVSLLVIVLDNPDASGLRCYWCCSWIESGGTSHPNSHASSRRLSAGADDLFYPGRCAGYFEIGQFVSIAIVCKMLADSCWRLTH